jgi:hypothetical protein
MPMAMPTPIATMPSAVVVPMDWAAMPMASTVTGMTVHVQLTTMSAMTVTTMTVATAVFGEGLRRQHQRGQKSED